MKPTSTSRIPFEVGDRARLRQPPITVRWRLTVLYGTLFLVTGAALLTITYVLVAHATLVPANPQPPRFNFVNAPASLRAGLRSVGGQVLIKRVVEKQRIADLHQLVIESGVALGIMALVSALLGWMVAGRVLAPLRTITAATKQISETNLHERLRLPGPQDELRELADTIDKLLERLEAAFEAQRRFVANASHELRTPLTVMRTTLDVAMGKPGGVPPQLQVVDTRLRVDLDHAERLLESFLVLARAQHGELDKQSSVRLNKLISVALADRASAITANKLDVHSELSPVRLHGSAILLTRMIDNVFENAVRHNQPGGSIDIALWFESKEARLIVENSGQKLDERTVAQLAQPFRRLGPERTGSEGGHGLGLSIIAAIAVAHGGSLQLHARPQGGLRLEISLPCKAGPRPEVVAS